MLATLNCDEIRRFDLATGRPLGVIAPGDRKCANETATDGRVIAVMADPETAETWLRSFTDLRLALATRLGVEEGDEAVWNALPDEDPRAQAHDIYEWVGYLQETLVEALTD